MDRTLVSDLNYETVLKTTVTGSGSVGVSELILTSDTRSKDLNKVLTSKDNTNILHDPFVFVITLKTFTDSVNDDGI